MPYNIYCNESVYVYKPHQFAAIWPYANAVDPSSQPQSSLCIPSIIGNEAELPLNATSKLHVQEGGAATLVSTVPAVLAAPSGFPANGNGLWYTQPSRFDAWTTDWLPIGNGYLGATLLGDTVQEVTQLNIESLWSGGPSADPSYNGGNKLPADQASTAQAMQVIRQTIFQSPEVTIDNVVELTTPAGAYGSYVGAGYILSTLDNSDGNVTNFFRWLDLDSAVHRTSWTQGKTRFLRESFCSHPTQACVQHINTSDASALPALAYAYSLTTEGIPTPIVSCLDNSTLQITGSAARPGMAFEVLARVSVSGNASSVTCTPVGSNNATITVEGASESWIAWVGDTNYDMDAGNAAHNFTFRGADPHDALIALLTPVTASSVAYEDLMNVHVADYSKLMGRFHLDLGQTPDLSTPTDQLVAAYQTDVGNTYLEWLLFNYGRYLLASSARGTLPANLQGKWAKDTNTPWSGDYHSNINIQMNYWFAELTNMDLVTPLFDYFEKTWVPRGTETAQILYNISQGWVTHNEMNIFGHTGMKGTYNTASYADYPESNAWMMVHVWDHLDFTQDIDWFKRQGWPLLKSTAQFHLQKLVPDQHFNDSTLVVIPCNSPEQPFISLGCAHAQQLIWQLFNAAEKGFHIAGDTDTHFLDEVRTKRAQMDKGVHIGSWGQLQEWKVDRDDPNDTHRHLSHLIGLYPGYALTNYDPKVQATAVNYTRAQVLAATQTSLIHRGNGTGSDADSGWEKVWRAACWAQLQNATEFYHELSYALERNFGSNLFSLYSGTDDSIFQIDANFGFPAALLNGLIQTPDQASLSDTFTISLLPALPSNWKKGSIQGARLRGGLIADFSWENGDLTSLTITAGPNAPDRHIVVMYDGKEIKSFTTKPGISVTM